MKNQVKSVTDPYARERMAAEFILKMIMKYGHLITLQDESTTKPEKNALKTDLEER